MDARTDYRPNAPLEHPPRLIEAIGSATVSRAEGGDFLDHKSVKTL
jgi:hypothetical protein